MVMKKLRTYSRLASGVICGAALILGPPAMAQRFTKDDDSRLHAREVSEQEHALRRRESGDLRPFGELLTRAQSVGRGEYLGVEPDLSNSTYRFKFMRPGANVIWVDVDGRTGRVLSAR